MELTFERADLLQLDAISNRNTMHLLPIGKKRKQKLVIGDDTGNVGCYEFKKGEPVVGATEYLQCVICLLVIMTLCCQVSFNNKMFDGPVSALTVAGVGVKKDKVFMELNALYLSRHLIYLYYVVCVDFCLPRTEDNWNIKER